MHKDKHGMLGHFNDGAQQLMMIWQGVVYTPYSFLDSLNVLLYIADMFALRRGVGVQFCIQLGYHP